MRGDLSTEPNIVAYPRDEADVIAVRDWAAEGNLAVVPYGGGTSVVGGIECRDHFRGIVSLDVRHLDGVVDVDEERLPPGSVVHARTGH